MNMSDRTPALTELTFQLGQKDKKNRYAKEYEVLRRKIKQGKSLESEKRTLQKVTSERRPE